MDSTLQGRGRGSGRGRGMGTRRGQGRSKADMPTFCRSLRSFWSTCQLSLSSRLKVRANLGWAAFTPDLTPICSAWPQASQDSALMHRLLDTSQQVNIACRSRCDSMYAHVSDAMHAFTFAQHTPMQVVAAHCILLDDRPDHTL